MTRIRFAITTLLGFLFVSTSARAEWQIHFGFSVGYAVFGDSSVEGQRANPTGGATLVPHARASVELRDWIDAVYTQSPMLVTPFSADDIGLVDANDLGLSVHTKGRGLTFLASGTVAPTYMNFCNVQWCFREFTMVYGGAAELLVMVYEARSGRALHLNVAGRLLYAEPTAWMWEGLPAADRQIVRTTTMFSGGAEWSW